MRLFVWQYFAPRGARTDAALSQSKRGVALLAAALAMALVSACATPLPSAQSASQTPANELALRTDFSLAGRFSAKTEREQVSGQFRYSQRSDERSLNLYSPLGTPIAEIVAQSNRAVLTQADGATQSADSMAALLRSVIDLPVTDAMMSAWLQGLPSQANVLSASGVGRDARGLPSRFVESGWEIEIGARMEGDTAAPKRMRWRISGLKDIEVRWVIDEWGAR